MTGNNDTNDESAIGNQISPHVLEKLGEMASTESTSWWETDSNHPFYNPNVAEDLEERKKGIIEWARTRRERE